jgi:predicted RNA binding protein YcfA (HicA-like mRNA interferase family)
MICSPVIRVTSLSVETWISTEPRPNNSLDRSADSLFLNLIVGIEVEFNRRARSTRTFDLRGVLVERYGKVACVGKPETTLLHVLRGASDANVSFADLCALLRHLGFDERIRGSHHIFTKQGILEILNLQPRRESQTIPG